MNTFSLSRGNPMSVNPCVNQRSRLRPSLWSGFLIALLALPVEGLLPSSAQAQEGTRKESTKGAVVKGRAPTSKDVLRVTFPRPQAFTLKNGLTVLVLEDHRLPTLLMQTVIPSGSLSEPSGKEGLASVVVDLLKEGTATMTSAQIAEALDGMGAGFFSSANFGSDTMVVGISGLSEYEDALVTLYRDLLLKPTFPADELQKYQVRELAGLEQQRARAEFLANERMMAALYPGHPMQVTAPTKASLSGMTREDLVAFHARFVSPVGSYLAVAGDVDVKTFIPKLEQVFADWTTPAPQKTALSEGNESQALTIHLVHRPGSVQTNLVMGNIGVSRTDPDYPIVNVMNQVFGAGSSSRLFMKLREEKGYTYGAYSSFRMEKLRGPWSANAEVRTEVTEGSMTEFVNELKRIRTEPVSDTELENARRSIVARFALSLERNQALTNRATELRRYNLPEDYWDKYPEKIQAVTKEDIQRVAQRYLDPARMQVVAVGDADKIRDVLKKFGTVIEYDVDGKLLNRQP